MAGNLRVMTDTRRERRRGEGEKEDKKMSRGNKHTPENDERLGQGPLLQFDCYGQYVYLSWPKLWDLALEEGSCLVPPASKQC